MPGPSKRRFEEIFSQGKRVPGKFCRLVSLPGSSLIGFATAKKIGCHARRNRIRRRFQSAIQEIGLEQGAPLDLIVIIGTAALDVEVAEIKEELKILLERMQTRWAAESECS